MKLKALEMTLFRNYDAQQVSFCPGVNILYGNNAQGKTNVIEAVHLLSTGKSHRTKQLSEMMQYGSKSFQLIATVDTGDREETIEMRYRKETGREIYINGVKREKVSSMLGIMRVLLFSPETLDVIKGGPSERRRYLDIVLCQMKPKYLALLQQYNHLLREKSAALKDRNQNKFADLFPIWNEGLAKAGAGILRHRLQLVKHLDVQMNKEIDLLSNQTETVSLSLKSVGMQDIVEDGFENALLTLMENHLPREKEQGICLIGPHRDDIDIELCGKSSRQFASQGQQRSLALALILATMDYFRQETGELPILLLDDVMSELDEKRRNYLIAALADTQTLITTTDRHEYDARLTGETRYIRVVSGHAQVDGGAIQTAISGVS